MKRFTYLAEAASNAINLGQFQKALNYIEEIDQVLQSQDNEENGLFVTDGDKSKVETLRAQALCNMNRIDEGIAHYHLALKWIGLPQVFL